MRSRMRYAPAVLLFALVSACQAEDTDLVMSAAPPGSESSPATTPVPSTESFRMTVMDVFSITGRGLVVTGVIDRGTVAVGDAICIASAKVGTRRLVIEGIESFRKLLESAQAGENVGLLVVGIDKDDVSPGDVLSSGCAD